MVITKFVTDNCCKEHRKSLEISFSFSRFLLILFLFSPTSPFMFPCVVMYVKFSFILIILNRGEKKNRNTSSGYKTLIFNQVLLIILRIVIPKSHKK